MDAADGTKGSGTMASWIIIILAYVVIVVGVINIGGSDFSPLF
jgi:hypothetical protein